MKNPMLGVSAPELWLRCQHYDRLEVFGPVNPRSGHEIGYARAYRERRRRTLAAVHAVARPAASVLDIAAAQGNFSLALAESGYRVTWNDLRGDLIPYVQAKHDRGEVRYAPGNCFEIGAEPFDVVLATEIIEHVAHPDQFLARLAKLVVPGGAVVLTTPNGAYWRNSLPRFTDTLAPEQYEAVQFKPDADGHIFLLYPDEIRRLAVAAGFVVREVSLFTNPLTRGALRLDRVLPLVPAALVQAVERLTASGSGERFARINMQMLAVLQVP